MRLSSQAAAAQETANLLVEAIKKDTLGLIAPKLLTVENLSASNSDGITPMYTAFLHGRLKHIPGTALTEAAILAKGQHGATPMHGAAVGHKLTSLPANLLEPKYLMVQDGVGEAPIHVATAAGDLPSLPKTIRANPKCILLASKSKMTPLLYAAARKQLNLIDASLITIKNLRKVNHQGRNCFHALAVNGGFGQLPAKLVTLDALCVKDNDGIRPVDLALRYAQTDSIPADIREQATKLAKQNQASMVF